MMYDPATGRFTWDRPFPFSDEAIALRPRGTCSCHCGKCQGNGHCFVRMNGCQV
jgi:hypothetical protein